MHLRLHIGTEKTGSSFLQKACADNRQFLSDKGIFFPSAGVDEERLVSGSVSPGNARELTDNVAGKRWDQVSRILTDQINAAEIAGSKRILFSNENLVVALAEQGCVEKFENVATRCGVRSIDALLVIRDPVDQAISLYKHRSKNGRAGSVAQWVRSSYKLPRVVRGFLNQVDQSGFSLSIRKYTKQSDLLVSMFFSEWLDLGIPPNLVDSSVNPSLTLSEIRLLQGVAAIRTGISQPIHARLAAIPLEEKARDSQLEIAARGIVENYISRFGELWLDLSSRMARDGGVEIPRSKNDSHIDDTNIVLNDKQVSVFVAGLEAAISEDALVTSKLRRLARSAIAWSRKAFERSEK